VADRFALGERDTWRGQGPVRAADGARGAALGARLLFAQLLGLLFEGGAEGAFGQTGSGDAGQLFHDLKVDVQTRAVIAESPAGDDFAPTSGQSADFLKEFGGKVTAWHGQSCLVLGEQTRE
jgi:hypothetical protein